MYVQHRLLARAAGMSRQPRRRAGAGDAGRHDAALRAGGGLRGRRGARSSTTSSASTASGPSWRQSERPRNQPFEAECAHARQEAQPGRSGQGGRLVLQDDAADGRADDEADVPRRGQNGHVATPERGGARSATSGALRRAWKHSPSPKTTIANANATAAAAASNQSRPRDEEPGRCPERGHRGQRRRRRPSRSRATGCARTIVTVLTRKMRPIAVSLTPASL